MKPLFSVKVRVPATTANLGPGFDVLGLALTLYNEVQLTGRRSGPPLTIINRGEGAESLPRDKRHLVFQAIARTFKMAGRALPASLELKLLNNIPLARGLGSSSAAIVGGIVVANAAIDNFFSEEEILAIATDMEGHPDNAAPAVMGGLCISGISSKGAVQSVAWRKRSLFEGIRAVVCVPSFELSTRKARAVLPKKVLRRDAIFTSARVALLLAALVDKRRDLLAEAMDDRLHQPYRAKLVPGLASVIEKAKQAGAFGAALSGAGPSVLALSPLGKVSTVGRAMQKAFAAKKISSRVLVLDVDYKGAR